MAPPGYLVMVSLLIALSPGPADSASARVVDAGTYAYAREESPAHGEAAAAAMDFITAEASASAAEAAIMEAANGLRDLDVWDPEDEEGLDEAGVDENDTAPPQPPPPGPVVPAPLDALFDFTLGAVAHELVLNNSAEQPVPDFAKDFHARVGPFKVHGYFKANGGTAGDLSSLFRDGSVTVRPEAGGVLVLEAAAGLRHLRLRFRHYSARAGPIRVSGTLEVEASPASLRAVVELVPPCTVRLRSLQVARLGPLQVRASGLGVLRRLLPLMKRWFNKRMRGDVERLVVQHLTSIITGELQRVSCRH